MPRGINRTDLNKTGTSYRNGTPITLPHEFGNAVILPKDFGNKPPQDAPGNPVILPKDFGNQIRPSGPASSYLLQADGVSHFLLANTSGAIVLS